MGYTERREAARGVTQLLKLSPLSSAQRRETGREHHAAGGWSPPREDQVTYLVLLLRYEQRTNREDATPGTTSCLCWRATAGFAAFTHPTIREG